MTSREHLEEAEKEVEKEEQRSRAATTSKFRLALRERCCAIDIASYVRRESNLSDFPRLCAGGKKKCAESVLPAIKMIESSVFATPSRRFKGSGGCADSKMFIR